MMFSTWMCNQIFLIHHQHFLINFDIKQWKTNEKIHYKWSFCFGRVKFGIINGNYTRIQCWLCITKNGDCDGRDKHLFEGRSWIVFIFIAWGLYITTKPWISQTCFLRPLPPGRTNLLICLIRRWMRECKQKPAPIFVLID
jgi:hypothetical protein